MGKPLLSDVERKSVKERDGFSPGGVNALGVLSLIVPQFQYVGLGRRSSTRMTHLAAPAHSRCAFTPHARVGAQAASFMESWEN